MGCTGDLFWGWGFPLASGSVNVSILRTPILVIISERAPESKLVAVTNFLFCMSGVSASIFGVFFLRTLHIASVGIFSSLR